MLGERQVRVGIILNAKAAWGDVCHSTQGGRQMCARPNPVRLLAAFRSLRIIVAAAALPPANAAQRNATQLLPASLSVSLSVSLSSAASSAFQLEIHPPPTRTRTRTRIRTFTFRSAPSRLIPWRHATPHHPPPKPPQQAEAHHLQAQLLPLLRQPQHQPHRQQPAPPTVRLAAPPPAGALQARPLVVRHHGS